MESVPRRQGRERRAPRLPGVEDDDYEVTSVSRGPIDVGATVRRQRHFLSGQRADGQSMASVGGPNLIKLAPARRVRVFHRLSPRN
jgi:hypothetical protein